MSATSPRPDLTPAAALPARRPWLRTGADAVLGLRRLPVWATWLALGLLLGVLGAREARTSAVQSRLLAALNQRLTFSLVPGPSTRFAAPRHGPYDNRLGYVRVPEWTARLEREGFSVREQAEVSPTLARVAALGLTPPYDEKTRTGLVVRGRSGSPVFQVTEPARGYAAFDAVPALVRDTLMFVENRELLHEEPRRNPAIEWDRFARAALVQLGGGGDGDSRGPGGSTLATQIEKYRHSAGGLTSGPLEKLRQIGSASLRAYRHGEDTRAVRRGILLDYLNSLPLAAAAGRGEVLGLAAGLETWYGADFDRTNVLLAAPVDARDPAGLAEQANAYRQTLSLLLATRRPSDYLRGRPEALEALADRHLGLLAEEGVIPLALRDAALAARPRRVVHPAPPAAPAGPAEPVRRWLVGALAVPDYYALDRLDLSVTSTLDEELQQQVQRRLEALADPRVVAASGLRGKGLLESARPGARDLQLRALRARRGHEPPARAGRQLRRRARRERGREARPRLDRQAARARELPRGDRRRPREARGQRARRAARHRRDRPRPAHALRGRDARREARRRSRRDARRPRSSAATRRAPGPASSLAAASTTSTTSTRTTPARSCRCARPSATR